LDLVQGRAARLAEQQHVPDERNEVKREGENDQLAHVGSPANRQNPAKAIDPPLTQTARPAGAERASAPVIASAL
jgi:hypothetical protein